MSLRMKMVWDVLEAAQDAGDGRVISACRRAIVANRLGRRIAPADMALIEAFA